MAAYIPRVLDLELDELLTGAPAIALDGPKGVGKTETLLRRANTAHALDNPLTVTLLEADPERLELDEPPILLDEWQRMPAVWDMVRRSVDRNPSAGRFLLAGSAVPVEAPVHSGAGRILSVRMRPLSLAERLPAEGGVSLVSLLTGLQPNVSRDSALKLRDYADEIVASGFPAIRPLPARVRRAMLDSYIERIVQHDLLEQGYRIRRPDALLAWLRAYAAATATNAAYNRILDASTPGEAEKPARTTTEHFRSLLTQLWLLEPLPAWLPARATLQRLAQAPKHHLADPALSARLLGVSADSLLSGHESGPVDFRDGELFGRLFESLVTLSVRVYAQASEARVSHLRTRNGDREIDLIVERADGAVVALEVKLSPVVNDDDVRHLHWLKRELGPELLDAAVITTGKHAYRRPDGIAVIPAAVLAT